jgi:hypothetical protein
MAEIRFTDEDRRRIDELVIKHDPAPAHERFRDRMTGDEWAQLVDYLRAGLRESLEAATIAKAISPTADYQLVTEIREARSLGEVIEAMPGSDVRRLVSNRLTMTPSLQGAFDDVWTQDHDAACELLGLEVTPV